MIGEGEQRAELAAENARLRAENERLRALLGAAGAARAAGFAAGGDLQPGRLEEIVDAAPDYIGTATADGRLRYLNRAGRQMLGIDEVGSLEHLNIADVHPAWAGVLILETGIPAAIRDGVWRGETALLTRDGREIPTAQVILTHRAPSGEVTFMSTIIRDISAEKDAARRAEEGQASLRRLIEASPVAMGISDARGNIEYVNARFTEVFGYRRDDIARVEDWFAVAYPDPGYRQRVAATWGAALESARRDGSDIRSFDVEVTCRDGSVRVTEVKGAVIDDRLFALFNDVTARTRAQEALARSEASYRFLHESIRDGFAGTDLAGRLQEVNPAFCEMLGYTADALRAMDYEAFTPAKWRAFEADILERQVRTRGFSEIYEKEYRRKDGTVFPVELRVLLLRDAAGAPSGYWAIVRDITDRKRVESQLQERERRYRELVENANSIILRWNVRGEITFMNEYGLRFFGYTEAELLGRSVMETIVPAAESSGRDLRPLMDAICRHPDRYQLNVNENVRRNGERAWVAWTNRAVVDDAGQVTEVFSVGSDVTDRRRMEDELRQHRDALEQLVEQRTHELRLAKDAAEAANRAKSQFLATMSHEIRTPLNGVLGMAELLRDSDLSREQRRHATTLLAAGRSLLDIVDEILDFSKIESGKLELRTVAFDLCALLDDTAAMLRERAAAKGLALTNEWRSQAPLGVVGDPGRLRQVVTNLLGNAIKFTEAGGIALRLELADEDAHAVTAHIEVADTGKGIAPEAQIRIFDPFVQEDGSTTRRQGGVGLGLAICRRLVETIGGEIGVDSVVGRGSRFWIRVPLARGALDAGEALSPYRAAIAGAKPNPRVLVAEDNEVNQAVASAMLERLGCRVTLVGDGREALAELAAGGYDVALVDCDMPVMDGFTATRELRRSEASKGAPRLPVVALTANVVQGFREQCIAAGMDDYLSKPYTGPQLAAALERWLSPRAAGRALPPTAEPASAPPDEPALDRKVLDEIRALQQPGAPDLVARVVSIYLETTPGLVQAMADALAKGDATALMKAAHSLKSSSGNVGAKRFAALLKEIEDRGRRNRLADAAALFAGVEAELLRVRAGLAAAIGG